MIQGKACLTAACVLAVAIFVGPPALLAAPVDSGEVKLTADLLNDFPALQSPKKIKDVNDFLIQGASGQVQIAGRSLAVSADRTGLFGVDVNGDGKVDPKEMSKPNADGVAGFRLQFADGNQKKEFPIIFSQLRIYSSGTNVTNIVGRVFSGRCHRGMVNGVLVRILDENLDGKITQDGADAILIGNGPPCAMPLMKVHQIGSAHYEIKVAEDGTSLTFSKLADLKLGPVETSLLAAPALQALIVVDQAAGRSYNLVASKAGVPAGDYKLVYGIIAAGKDPVVILPTPKTPKYALQAETINAIRIGPPLRIAFQATQSADGNLTVLPNIRILGAGDELYQVDFHGIARPQVVLMEGKQILAMEGMGFG